MTTSIIPTSPAPNSAPSRRRTVDSGATDAELIATVRADGLDGFAQLYHRHVDAASGFARSLTRCAADADDVVSEAFARILELFRAGRGPDDHFRPYLLRTVRNIVNDGYRRERRVEVSDDIEVSIDADPCATAVEQFDQSAARRALESLPERWRDVLWRLEVLDLRPRQLADEFDQSAHNVSALAHRAREGLRNAYLSCCHPVRDAACERFATRLGAFARGATGTRERDAIQHHVDRCETCSRALDGIDEQIIELRLERPAVATRHAS